MYGSNFCSRTRSPRCSSSMPIDAQVSPLPRELTTPPVTKMCLAIASKSCYESLFREGSSWEGEAPSEPRTPAKPARTEPHPPASGIDSDHPYAIADAAVYHGGDLS